MTKYEEFKIYLCANQLDVKLAEPIIYAPELCTLYPWPKLVFALAIISDEFKPVSTSIGLKPIVYSITKFEAFKANSFISAYINNTLADSSVDTLRNEILHRIGKIFKENIA